MNALALVKDNHDSKTKNKEILDKIKARSTNELIIAFSGLMGSGISRLVEKFQKKFEKKGYEVNCIKLSDFIKERYSEIRPNLPEDQYVDYSQLNNDINKISYYEKISTLQSIGNFLREKYSTSILSQYAINKILTGRINKFTIENQDCDINLIIDNAKEQNLKKITFIDSIKHLDEYSLLKVVYGNMLYLIGILCPEKIRIQRIINDYNIDIEKLKKLIERDKKEEINNGQQSLKVLQESDIFIRNISLDTSNNSIERYVDLILGEPYIRPTIDEFGMFTAQAAAQQSGCISRQVGASIFSKYNDIISTGCNDAPVFGGGHFSNLCVTQDNDLIDNRCCSIASDQKCKNSEELGNILEDIKKIIKDEVMGIKNIDADKLGNTIFENTRIKSLIEFSKAVHAEMDAITTAARNGCNSLRGATLYSTTFPCHLCATNIIASGIERVYYIEPYLKSLAVDLHEDQVNFDPKNIDLNDQENKGKVLFLPFEGVAPKQYLNFFKSCDRKNKDGTKIEYDIKKAIPALKQMMDTYTDYEAAISDSFKDLVDKYE